MTRPTLLDAAHDAAVGADITRQHALRSLSAAALDVHDARPGGDAALQRALRELERATVARRRAAAVVRKLQAVAAGLDAPRARAAA